jgi:hypothetical protein
MGSAPIIFAKWRCRPLAQAVYLSGVSLFLDRARSNVRQVSSLADFHGENSDVGSFFFRLAFRLAFVRDGETLALYRGPYPLDSCTPKSGLLHQPHAGQSQVPRPDLFVIHGPLRTSRRRLYRCMNSAALTAPASTRRNQIICSRYVMLRAKESDGV